MRVGYMQKLLEGVVGVALKERKGWYNIKYDRRLLLPFETDFDVVSLIQGNDDHTYLYIARMGGPRAGYVIVTEEQVEGEFHHEGTVGTDAGIDLLKGNANAAAVRGKLCRADGVEQAVQPHVQAAMQLTSRNDIAHEGFSDSKSRSKSDDGGETVL